VSAAHLLQCGTDLSLITRWLGHENPATMHIRARASRVMNAAKLEAELSC
jgi:site-specific recombinase XerD